MARPKSWGDWVKPDGVTRPGPEMAQPIATTADGRDITRPWVRELEEANDPRLLSSADWGIYDRILLDDQVKSCMEQRIRAVVSRDWNVLSGKDGDPRADAAAAALSVAIDRVGWDRTTEKMLYATLFGYSVAELMWGPFEGLLAWSEIRVRHARRFRQDKDGRLRLLTRQTPTGEILPDRKFWKVTSGGTDDDTPYGRGLAEWLHFPVLFKRNGIRFWNIFLDKFSVPTAMGKYPRGSAAGDPEKLLAAVQAIATDSGFVIPEGMTVELLQLAQTGADFAAVCRYMDGAIAKVILSQTMTTDNGSSKSQGEVHADVKIEVIKADADLLTDAFTFGPARWFTDLNFGPDVATPRVVRVVEQEADLKMEAEKDEILSRIGWRRTDESFGDTYGEGFERVEPTPPPANATDPRAALRIAANDTTGTTADGKPVLKVASFAADDPRPLYVYRSVKNGDEIIAWAKEQGFASILPAAELHVTVMYSRRPVNWFEMASDFVLGDKLVLDPGGPRVVDRLGEAVVLHFASQDLAWRNRQMRNAGASWDYAQFLPHIALTYQPGDLDLSKVVPYLGRIVLGPEIFEAIDDGYDTALTEIALAEPLAAPAHPHDVVDEAVDAIMAEQGWRPLVAPIVDPIVAALQAATSLDEVQAILAREAEQGDDSALAESLARAGFALRIDALTDTTGDA